MRQKSITMRRYFYKFQDSKAHSYKVVAKPDFLMPRSSKLRKTSNDVSETKAELIHLCEQSEQVINYYLLSVERTNTFWEQFLYQTSLSKTLDISKLLPSPSEDDAFRKAVENLLKNETAQKKNLFAGFRQNIKDQISQPWKDFNAKYDKFYSNMVKNDQSLRENIYPNPSSGFYDSGSFSLTNINPKKPQLSETIEAFPDLKIIGDCFEYMSKSLKKTTLNETEYSNYQKLFKTIEHFQNEFTQSMEKYRDKLLIIHSPSFSKIDFDSDFKSFQKSLDVIQKRNNEFQMFTFRRLSELREQNTQLIIVRDHMNKLFK